MEQRTYTQKELYEFVTEYSREAREEGFDMSVGDFADWIAAQDEKDDKRYIDPKIIEMAKRITKDIDDKLHGFPEEEDKPVLPEKLFIHQSQDVKDPDTLLDILLDIHHAVNTTVDYLKEKNL